MAVVNIKTPEEVKVMAEGGKKLAHVKKLVEEAVKIGVSALEIEEIVTKGIIAQGGTPSFKMVPGYRWSTCININDGIVHGIPKKEMVFQEGDVVSVDLGMFYKGFHTDTSISVYLGSDPKTVEMLSVGKKALKNAIREAQMGNKLGDISYAIEKTLESAKLNPVESLVGHGVGRNLHEYPPIPCFVTGSASDNIELKEGFVLAIEVMYTQGNPELVTDSDGWTIRTKDGKISALFEETVAITANGPIVLTAHG
ncbi:type I methionyl aminopeptidase [Candidatus Microgenomates bacterium]|nr:type I methionyl aminopeptidase [Candidatus Microgenomates bacterium]